MAEVDFSNARIEVDTSISTRYNPTYMSYVNLSSSPTNANNALIATNTSTNMLINTKKQLVFLYTGTFTESGTEFYIFANNNPAARWRIYNISFNSGDTYVFQINATLTCN